MKELTIQEKARAYDEALKAAVVAHKDEDRHLKATLERIFPVLRESRDEEIWKWLIEMVEEVRKANPTNAEHNGMCSEAIALLEKQCEQKKSYDTCDSSMFDNKKSPYGEKRDFGYFEEKSADKVEPKFKEYDRGYYDALKWVCDHTAGDNYKLEVKDKMQKI